MNGSGRPPADNWRRVGARFLVINMDTDEPVGKEHESEQSAEDAAKALQGEGLRVRVFRQDFWEVDEPRHPAD